MTWIVIVLTLLFVAVLCLKVSVTFARGEADSATLRVEDVRKILQHDVDCLLRSRADDRERISKLETSAMKHDRASGGFWKTKDGTILRIRDMSDSHLDNAIKYTQGFTSAANARRLMLREVARRKEDAVWAQRFGRLSSTDELHEMTVAVGDLSNRAAMCISEVNVLMDRIKLLETTEAKRAKKNPAALVVRRLEASLKKAKKGRK